MVENNVRTLFWTRIGLIGFQPNENGRFENVLVLTGPNVLTSCFRMLCRYGLISGCLKQSLLFGGQWGFKVVFKIQL